MRCRWEGTGIFPTRESWGVTTLILANNLGNLVSRVATVKSHSKCNGVGPAPRSALAFALAAPAAEALRVSTEAWARWAPHEALEPTWRLIGATEAELRRRPRPWKMEVGPAVDVVLGNALEKCCGSWPFS